LLVREGERFVLGRDPRLPPLHPRMPVSYVTLATAEAYAAWYAVETGRPWRLPSEVEWERMARGADRRAWPWGNGYDPGIACLRDAFTGPPVPASVDDYPDDVSVYGVRGLGGNAMGWTSTPMGSSDEVLVSRVRKGGAWNVPSRIARIAYRTWHNVAERLGYLGFRLVCDWR
jgi:serine/threonine-protein kinase